MNLNIETHIFANGVVSIDYSMEKARDIFIHMDSAYIAIDCNITHRYSNALGRISLTYSGCG